MAYIPEIGGYIADVPNIEFLRDDDEWFAFDKVSTSSMTNNSNTITINGGWSKSPLAIIDTESTIEMVFESAMFTPEIFAAANSASVLDDTDSVVFESNIFTVSSDLKVVIPHAVDVSRTKIKGLAYTASTIAAGKFTAVVGTGEDAATTTVTFNTGDVTSGQTVRVGYYRLSTDATVVTVKTTDSTAIGEAWIHYPIFNKSDAGKSGTMLGVLHIHLYRVRVSALPGFNSSYKSAGTNGMTFAALDPNRTDKAFFKLTLEEFVNGAAVASTDVGTADTDWTA